MVAAAGDKKVIDSAVHIKQFTDGYVRPLASLSSFLFQHKSSWFSTMRMKVSLYFLGQNLKKAKRSIQQGADEINLDTTPPHIASQYFLLLSEAQEELHDSYEVVKAGLAGNHSWIADKTRAHFLSLLDVVDTIYRRFKEHYQWHDDRDGELFKRVDPHSRLQDRPASRPFVL